MGRVVHGSAVMASRMGRGALWGFVVGLGIGVLGRTIMRSVALLGGMEPTWTAEFSLHLVVLIATLNTALGLSFAVIRDVLPGGRRRGLVFGGIALAFALYPGLIAEAHVVAADLGWGPTIYGVTALSGLFLLDGVWLEAAIGARDRREAELLDPEWSGLSHPRRAQVAAVQNPPSPPSHPTSAPARAPVGP